VRNYHCGCCVSNLRFPIDPANAQAAGSVESVSVSDVVSSDEGAGRASDVVSDDEGVRAPDVVVSDEEGVRAPGVVSDDEN
jgi:hypothetical protein